KSEIGRFTAGSTLLHNVVPRTGRFSTPPAAESLRDAGWAWGAAWTDVDGDGLEDLAVANGMLIGKSGKGREVDFWTKLSAGWTECSTGKWAVDQGEEGLTGAQRERLFLNLGDGTFADVAYAAGFDTMGDLRGLVSADVTGDGAPDLVGGVFLNSP